jgi:uncharacterized protein YjlB
MKLDSEANMQLVNHQAYIAAYRFADDGTFPNNIRLPVLIYRQVLRLTDGNVPRQLEALLKQNHWENCWRNGIYGYHHYHSTAHEMLCIYQGNAVLQVGGPHGIIFKTEEGDALFLPAGVAHKSLVCSQDFSCVGAYPEGTDYDMNTGKNSERPQADERIRMLADPMYDPLFGKFGPLILRSKTYLALQPT